MGSTLVHTPFAFWDKNIPHHLLLPSCVPVVFSALVNFIKIDRQTTVMGYGMKSLITQALGSHHNSFYDISDVPLLLQDLLAPYLPTFGVYLLTENFNCLVDSAIYCRMLQFSTHSSSSSQPFSLASIFQLVVSVLFLFFSIGQVVHWLSMRHNACTITRRMPPRCLSETMTTKQLLFILLSLSVMTVSGWSPHEVILC